MPLSAQEKLVAEFSKHASAADKNSCKQMSLTEKTKFRLDWKTKRVTNVRNTLTHTTAETNADVTEGWYCTRLQLIMKFGGVVDKVEASKTADVIIRKAIKAGQPYFRNAISTAPSPGDPTLPADGQNQHIQCCVFCLSNRGGLNPECDAVGSFHRNHDEL